MWQSSKQAGVQIDQVPSTVPGILQEAMVRGLKLRTTLLVPPCPKLSWVFGHWYDYKTSTTFPNRVNSQDFTSTWLWPVERLPSGLHVHGVLATISAPFRSGPSFPHCMCQWARRLSRVKLAVICGARSALRRWSRSSCERRCKRIYRVCVVCVVFTLNRSFYPTTSVHPVSVLIVHPREIQILWSQTVRQGKPKQPQLIKVKQVKC